MEMLEAIERINQETATSGEGIPLSLLVKPMNLLPQRGLLLVWRRGEGWETKAVLGNVFKDDLNAGDFCGWVQLEVWT